MSGNWDEIRHLRRSIDGLHAKLDRYHAEAARREALCSVCRPDVERHERILVGQNGEGSGLVDRVGSLERFRRRAWGAMCGLGSAIVACAAEWIARGTTR